MTEKATEKELAAVHRGMAEWCIEIMKGVPLVVDGVPLIEDGKVVRIPPAPAYLNVIRQYLKDNGIEAPALPKTPVGDLSDLPVFEDDNVVPITKTK